MTKHEERKFIKVESESNANKWWTIVQDGCTLTTYNGRVGETGQSRSWNFGNEYSAEREMETKCREKQRKGYEPLRTVVNSTDTNVVHVTNLEHIAKSQIQTNSPELDKLISLLSARNIHSIVSQTKITYNDDTGLFKTPLGIVTSDAILESRSVLSKIGDLVFRADYNNPGFNKLINQYLMLVPQDIGRSKPTPQGLYPSLEAVQAQNAILDALEVSLQQLTSVKTTAGSVVNQPKLFDVKLTLIDDGKAIDAIRNLYRSTRQAMHGCYSKDVKRVYGLEIGHMDRAFETDGKKVGNIKRLWHGSRICNVLAIIQKGFIIPPSSSSHCTGRIFGNGVYASDQSTKSLQYAVGSAPGQRGGYENTVFMFLNDVAMGREYTPRNSYECSSWDKPPTGYDSVFAKGGYSGVVNNEMIVYRTNQINPKYLIEFE